MAQPAAYNPTTDFSNEAASSAAGRSTVNPTKLDAELANIETTLDQTLTNLALIQRDDGKIRDGKVELHTLSAQVRALFATAGATIRGDWVTATSYAVKDIVTESGATYICATAHTSGTFATDLAADKWVLLMFAPSALSAAGVSNTPAGSISATDVQAAINELDGDVTALAAVVAAIDELPLSGGTMTGKITLDGNPSAALHAAPKQYVDDVIDGLSVGQCLLSYSSATQILLNPFNGNRLFIDGAWLTVPAAGVALSNSGLSAATTYYIYAYNNGGSIALEASATTRATDATYGHQIKNGDASRTLVGMVRTNSSSQFSSIPTLVLSWFNRRRKRATSVFTANRSTSSTSAVEVNSEIRAEFLVWGASVVDVAFTGAVANGSSQATISYIGIDGTTSRSNGVVTSPGNTNNNPCAASESIYALSEGYHYATLCGFVGSASTSTWNATSQPAAAARLTAAVEG